MPSEKSLLSRLASPRLLGVLGVSLAASACADVPSSRTHTPLEVVAEHGTVVDAMEGRSIQSSSGRAEYMLEFEIGGKAVFYDVRSTSPEALARLISPGDTVFMSKHLVNIMRSHGYASTQLFYGMYILPKDQE